MLVIIVKYVEVRCFLFKIMPALDLLNPLVKQSKAARGLSTLVLRPLLRLIFTRRGYTEITIFSKVAISCLGFWAADCAQQ